MVGQRTCPRDPETANNPDLLTQMGIIHCLHPLAGIPNFLDVACGPKFFWNLLVGQRTCPYDPLF